MNKLYAVKTTETSFGIKKMIVLFLIILLTLLSGPAYANQISTIDELTAAYNSEACIKCHKDTHNGWKNSWHGKSVIDPRVLRTWRTFILSGLDKSEGSRRDLKDICLPCHAPQTKDASDELITSIAGLIVIAVEEKDTYETKYEAAPSETAEEIPFSGPADDITITDIKDKDEFEIEYKLNMPDYVLPDSPWIRDEVDEAEDMTLRALEESESNFIENKVLDESAGYNTTRKPVEGEVLLEGKFLGEGKVLVKDEYPALEPEEDDKILLEPMEDMAIEIEDMTATIVIEDGKVKIEYSPYNPADDLKEPAFLDKGETLGEKAMEQLSKLNINCMICHSMKALPGGNPRPKTIYSTGSSGSIEHKESLGAETRTSGFMKTSEFCAQCHHGCPPGMPSSICPTLWTSYKESYIARGGEKTCQDCHMNGADKKNHSFPGIYDEDQLKRGIQITLDAEPTRYVYHLENRIVPAVVINITVKNTAGHSIPHGCTYIPQTALQVSVTDQNGNELFFKNKTYTVYNLHLPHNKEGYLGLNDWDITAMERLDMGIKPGDTDSQTFVATLSEDTTSIIIEASFKYIYEEGVSTVVHKEIKEIEFEIDKISPEM